MNYLEMYKAYFESLIPFIYRKKKGKKKKVTISIEEELYSLIKKDYEVVSDSFRKTYRSKDGETETGIVSFNDYLAVQLFIFSRGKLNDDIIAQQKGTMKTYISKNEAMLKAKFDEQEALIKVEYNRIQNEKMKKRSKTIKELQDEIQRLKALAGEE